MIVIIAEKAIAGARIASILAGKQLPQHTTDKAAHFDFEMQGKPCSVVPLRGHVVDVDFPLQYSHWLGTDLNALVNSPVEYKATEKVICDFLKKLGPEVEVVIVATDADREGEAIGLEALNLVKESNPKVKAQRALFSAITEKDISTAFSKLEQVDYNLAESANSRREIDLIWGAVLTRFLSLVSGQLGREFLSMGRVQGPTLALIVDREKERLAFKAEKYWVIEALFEKDKQQFVALHKEGRFTEKEKAEQAARCKEPPLGKVEEVRKSEKVLARPVPFNTTLFLRSATAIGLTASRAMQVAESLYQRGIISYPRTDNSVYPPTLIIPEVLAELKKVKEFAPLVEKLLQQKKLVPSAGKFAKDHPPIHPVTAAHKGQLDATEWKVYGLVCRRFMATLAEDAVTENLSVLIDLNKQPFVATGQIYLKLGWKFYYPYSKATEVTLPRLEKGDLVLLLKLDLLEKETQPPPRYSQGALIKAMSDLNLGTKSTRAEIIQKLYARKYISGQKAIEPNKIAFAVIDALEKYDGLVVKPEMTANLEQEMDLVASGKKEKLVVVSESRAFLSDILKQLLQNKNNIGSMLRGAVRADAMFGPCTKPGCKGELIVRKGRTGKRFIACSAYPACTNSFPLPQKGSITMLDKRCEQCGHPMIQVRSFRYSYKMCILPGCPSKADWKKKPQPAGAGPKTGAEPKAGALPKTAAEPKAGAEPKAVDGKGTDAVVRPAPIAGGAVAKKGRKRAAPGSSAAQKK
ncbi:MAG: DNA topoisomerase I [Candidatus Diapherotrites archaeon]|nr:DNA topoisomerase I [Candidatus Diapherotrites archaeon]